MHKYKIISILLLWSVSLWAVAQKYQLSGSVSDQKGEALVGANVYLQGTTMGTATLNNGSFIIKGIKEGNYQLSISFSGYKKFRKQINITKDITGVSAILNETTGSLGEIVVTGTGTPHHIKSAPVPTELISKKIIENIAAPDFTTLMQNVSPSFDFSPGTMGSFIQLNGLGNDFIVILIDGRRIYGDLGGMNDVNRINPDNIERIEIVKGASSSLYGSEAIGGVINIITKKSKRNIYVANNSRYSNYGTFQQQNNVDLNIGRLSSHTSFSYKKTDGWENSPYQIDSKDADEDGDEKDLIATDAMVQNKYNDYTLSQRFDFDVSQKTSVYALAKWYEKDYKLPLAVKKYGLFRDDLSLGLGGKIIIDDNNQLVFEANSDRFKYYYKYDKPYKDYTENQKVLQNEQQRQDVNAKWIGKISKKQTLTLGLEMLNEKYKSEGRVKGGEANVNTFSFYYQDEISITKKLDIVAGFRIVKHQEFGAEVSPKISTLYKAGNFNFRGTYSQGFKAPTLKELYYYYEKGTKLYLGNTDLAPQVSEYFSGGIDYHNSFITINLSAYDNWVNDLIAYKTIDVSDEQLANGTTEVKKHFNIEKARTKGADLLVDVKLPYGITVGGGYSYVDARDKTTNERLEYVAQNYANVRLMYDYKWSNKALNVGLFGRYQDKKYYDDGSAKAYQIWRLTAKQNIYRIGDFDFAVSAGVDNLFDEVDDSPYGSHYGTINPGRTFFVSVNINFTK